eukprot:215287_1
MFSISFILTASFGLLCWYLVYHTLAFYLKYSLKGKIMLITGCDTGFGNSLTRKLDKMGSIVFACCLNQSTANQLNTSTSENVHVLIMDVTNLEQIKNTYKIVKKFCIDTKSPLFGLVNNAGITETSPFECIPQKKFTKVIDVNCIGLINVTRIFLPLIRLKKYNPYIAGKFCKKFAGFYQRGKAGRIINIASVCGRTATPYLSAYNASKFAVIGFTESIRYELDQFFNIWCCTVEPWFVMTNIVKYGMNLENIKKQWLDVKKPDSIDMDDMDEKLKDDIDGIMNVYDIEKYVKWKGENNRLLNAVSLKNDQHVIDSIICALSSVYPLKVYYPSWRAMITTRLAKYVLPGFLIDTKFGKRLFGVKPIKDSFLRW